MSSYELQMRLDRSIPMIKLEGFPRFLNWQDADTFTTSDSSVAIQLIMGEDLESLSPRWNDRYIYGITATVDADGNPEFQDFPQDEISADSGVLTETLQPGKYYILIERTGGTLRDWKAGEAQVGTSVWSKAKVSGYLIVEVE